ncbi:dihydrodipicolinate synthase family protein [Cellulosimicrobium terreum]|uniref:Dihydrodipicolinate synthase family protein n=1 Tax=Cellulosimicrobium funkei TaxID=264251 RepID=A0A4Y8QZW0_9MICO|nr:dihydrodipicolinate synthase family protein [Cellulosimicrobium funkei]TGA71265.1 dihydrodipicolinate synthase family protein [Cellulosimicrobium terreum]
MRAGTVIPAQPLALDADRRLDERRQRALTRYYHAAGAGGVAVGVHTTQFEIREHGLLRPVLELAAEVSRATVAGDAPAGSLHTGPRPLVQVAGAAGDVRQAVAEAELAASLGYDAVLLAPRVPGLAGSREEVERVLLDRARAVGEVLPVIGFYLQEAIGGPRLSVGFWREYASIEAVVAIKAAPFHRYRTIDVLRGVAASGRGDEIALYTGNDDAIVADLTQRLDVPVTDAEGRASTFTARFVGGLLGQWAVWTRGAVETLALAHAAHGIGPDGGATVPDAAALATLTARAAGLTDANAAVFDAAHDFAGVIAGVHEVLRRQGLLDGIWCLDPEETLSPGQADELTRVTASYPWLAAADDALVAEHLEDWLR